MVDSIKLRVDSSHGGPFHVQALTSKVEPPRSVDLRKKYHT
jgi:hypothetical protein